MECKTLLYLVQERWWLPQLYMGKELPQEKGLVKRGKDRGKRRERAPWPGMMFHQDGSTHQWVKSGVYWNLIVTMDDATNEHYFKLTCSTGELSSL